MSRPSSSVVVQACLLSGLNVVVFLTIGYVVNRFVAPPPLSPLSTDNFQYKKTALVTATYFLFFYLKVFFQSMISVQIWGDEKKKGELIKKKNDDNIDAKNDERAVPSLWEVKYGPISYTDKRMVAGNRIVGNTMEQMTIFLMGLWLTAMVTNDDQHASMCGWVYLAFRSVAYPILYLYNPGLVLIATIPNYCTICYMWITIVKACLS